jgi:predicted Zn-dependent protease
MRPPRCIRWILQKPLYTLLLLAAWLVGCATEPVTGRSQFFLIGESETNAMGAQAFEQMMAESKISTNAEWNNAVLEVGRKIAAVTDERMKKEGKEPFQWEFKVIDDPKTVNAFCLPGGKVAFYTGILPICKSKDGIAVVMGHEVAHAYAQHGRSRISTQLLGQLGLAAGSVALESVLDDPEMAQIGAAALGVGYTVGVELPFSRDDESAADQIGLTLMAEAGYDPREAVVFWERMAEAAGGQEGPSFLSTHPSHGDRIQRLKELMPEAMKIYEQRKGSASD